MDVVDYLVEIVFSIIRDFTSSFSSATLRIKRNAEWLLEYETLPTRS